MSPPYSCPSCKADLRETKGGEVLGSKVIGELNDICSQIAAAHAKCWNDAILMVMKRLYGDALYDPEGPFGYAAWVLDDVRQYGVMMFHPDGRQEFAWNGTVVLRGSQQERDHALLYVVETVK